MSLQFSRFSHIVKLPHSFFHKYLIQIIEWAMFQLYKSNKLHITNILLCICVIIQHISPSIAKSTNEPIPDNQGQQYSYCWIIALIVSPIGVIYNVISLYLLLSLENRLSFYELNLALNVIDLLFTIGRSFFIATYTTHGGLYYGNAFCIVEAIWDMILIIWSCQVIVGISWVVRNDLCNNIKFSSVNMTRYIIASFLYAVALALIVINIAGAQLDSSGTYCFIPFASVLGFGLMSTAGIFIPISFLVYNAMVTYNTIQRAQKILESHGIKEQAKGHYIQMAKKLGFFFVTTMGCYSPGIVGALYEWITGQYFPPPLSVTGGVAAIMLSSFINPTLFFYLNVDLRDKFYEVFGERIYAMIGIHHQISKDEFYEANRHHSISKRIADGIRVAKRKSSVVPIKSNVVSVSQTSSYHPSDCPSSAQDQYIDFVYWLYDDQLSHVLKEHARKDYVMENFLFYEDAVCYRNKGKAIMKMISNQLAKNDANSDEIPVDVTLPIFISADIQREWKELEQLANKLYTLYIKTPSAPLEINIPCKVRGILSAVLKKPHQAQSECISGKGQFRRNPSVRVINNNFIDQETHAEFVLLSTIEAGKIISVVEEYVQAFDECIRVVHTIISSDIWPRFVKSVGYDQAIKDHQQQKI